MEYKYLYNISKISGGKRLPKGKMLIKTKNAHPYIKVKDMATYITNLNENFEYVPDDVFNSIKKYTTSSGDILLSIVGTIGNLTIVGESLDKASLTENCVKIETNQEVLSKYLYYYLTSRDGQQKIKNGIVGSTQPKLPLYNIESITVPIPDRTKQQHIVDTIGSVDDAIEKNNEIIDFLGKYAEKIYKYYNSLNNHGRYVELGEYTIIKTGKLNANAANEKGYYKFFTCSQTDSTIDTYSFDCEAIILSGNGEIYAKYYKGKFDAYQRTYVLEPSQYFFLYLLEIQKQIEKLKSSSQGSVIKFITKKMIESIKIPLNNASDDINTYLSSIYRYMHNLNIKNDALKSIKQKLLEKYFS